MKIKADEKINAMICIPENEFDVYTLGKIAGKNKVSHSMKVTPEGKVELAAIGLEDIWNKFMKPT